MSFSGALPDGAYNFFPQFALNGNIWRYNGEFTLLWHNSMLTSKALRALYARVVEYAV